MKVAELCFGSPAARPDHDQHFIVLVLPVQQRRPGFILRASSSSIHRWHQALLVAPRPCIPIPVWKVVRTAVDKLLDAYLLG